MILRYYLSSFQSPDGGRISIAGSLFALIEPVLYLIVTCLVLWKNQALLSKQQQQQQQHDDENVVLYSLILSRYISTLLWASICFSLGATIFLRMKSPTNDFTKKSTITMSRGTQNIHAMTRDDIGISMGSILPSLVLLSLFTLARDKGNSLLVYIALIATIGFSFALNSFIEVLQSRISTINKKTATVKKNSMLCIYIISIAMLLQNMGDTLDIEQYYKILFQTFTFTTIQFASLYIYYNNKDTNKYNKKQSIKISPLQKVFTIGEWVSVSSFISFLMTTYIMKYVSYYYPTNTTIPSRNHDCTNSLSSSYMTVSHAGLVGTIIGCIIPTSSLTNYMYGRISTTMENKFNNNNTEKMSLKTVISLVLRLMVVIGFVLIFVNHDLHHTCLQCYESGGVITNENIEWCYHFVQNNHGQARKQNNLIERGLKTSLPTNQIVFKWLNVFLFTPEYDNEDNQVQSMPRFIWLCYWGIVLVCTIPIAIVIAESLRHIQDRDRKKKLTIVARKYFHVVALLLFGPPTYFAPSMMYLSYSIAIALLCLIESLRFTYINSLQSSQSLISGTDLVTKSQSQSMIENGQILSSVDTFFRTFFDEKDLGAMDGGFVVTHIALILGCAMPLWFHKHYSLLRDDVDVNESIHYVMPYLGIIILGIGDAGAAYVGSVLGKIKWPESKRTLEGSLAMLISVLVSTFVVIMINCNHDLNELCYGRIWRVFTHMMIPVVILEAVTSQIDNFCLPMFSMALCCIIIM